MHFACIGTLVHSGTILCIQLKKLLYGRDSRMIPRHWVIYRLHASPSSLSIHVRPCSTRYWLCSGRSYVSPNTEKASEPGQGSNHELETPGSSRGHTLPLYHDECSCLTLIEIIISIHELLTLWVRKKCIFIFTKIRVSYIYF